MTEKFAQAAILRLRGSQIIFRVDFSGRGELAERQQKLAQLLSRLQKISEEYNVAVIITNQMTADPGATMSFQVRVGSRLLLRE